MAKAKKETKTKKKKKQPDKIRETEISENLKCMLTEAEVKQAAEEMARHLQEKSLLEDDLKSVKASFKTKIDAADASIIANSHLVRDKYEYRNVDCLKHQNFSNGQITITRLDTNMFYVNRKMDVREKQEESLFDSREAS